MGVFVDISQDGKYPELVKELKSFFAKTINEQKASIVLRLEHLHYDEQLPNSIRKRFFEEKNRNKQNVFDIALSTECF